MGHVVNPVKNLHDSDVTYYVVREAEAVAHFPTQKEAEEHVAKLDAETPVRVSTKHR